MKDDYDYFNNKRNGKLYISRPFEQSVPMDSDTPPRKLRILSFVSDGSDGLEYAWETQSVVLRRTPARRFELKFCFLEDSREVQSVTIQRFSSSNGKPHEKISFSLTMAEVDRLREALEFVRRASLDPDHKQSLDQSEVTASRVAAAQKLAAIQDQLTPEVLEEIARNNFTLYELMTLARRKQQLEMFQQLLIDDEFFSAKKREWQTRGDEGVWQKFFEENTWIFGYGLQYVFTTELDDRRLEQVTSGYNFQQAGKRVDALLKTQGMINALCFVELKTHKTALLAPTPYRPECWQISSDLTGSVAQVQKTVKKAEQDLKSRIDLRTSNGDPSGEVVFVYSPRSYVIIGTLEQFKTVQGINEPKYSSFELFRRSLVNPEIVTFDELYERAKFIVAQSEPLPDNRTDDFQDAVQYRDEDILF